MAAAGYGRGRPWHPGEPHGNRPDHRTAGPALHDRRLAVGDERGLSVDAGLPHAPFHPHTAANKQICLEEAMGRYEEVWQAAHDDPEKFWTEAAGAIDWTSAGTACSTPISLRSTAGSKAAN